MLINSTEKKENEHKYIGKELARARTVTVTLTCIESLPWLPSGKDPHCIPF